MGLFETIGGVIVAIVAIILIFGLPIILFIGLFYLIYRISRSRHEERLELIKSGKDLPVEIYRSQRRRKLFWGFIFSAIGGGALVIGIIDIIRKIAADRAYAIHGSDLWGIIPLLIGIVLIVFYKYFEQEKENGNMLKEAKTKEIKDEQKEGKEVKNK